MSRHVRMPALLALALMLSLIPTASSAANTNACEKRNNNTIDKLLECVTVDGVRAHQRAFQDIADANGGTRAAGTPGYDASAAYVAGLLDDAGYDVDVQEFDFPFFEQLSETLFSTDPTTGPWTDYVDFAAMNFSGSGTATGELVGVDLVLPPAPLANTSTSGCDVEDFDGFPSGSIAVVQRGSCSFFLKAFNAQEAGASGVVVFNEGQPGRESAFLGTLGAGAVGVITIPVIGASFALGTSVIGAEGTLTTDTFSEIRTTSNVIAQTTSGRTDNVVMVGAHLDSVPEGPGIQDNGSGSAAILEVALKMRKLKPENAVRFAWWGAEEFGLIGSDEYVFGLPEEELDDIALYLNFDMIGSPNHYFGVYDANESTFAAGSVPIPAGSEDIESVFESYYTSVGQPYDDSAFSGRSDYQAFIENDIPAGGLFTGAEVVKTPEQAAIWGGTAGDQFDPCYHLACDTFDNISLEALDVNSDAVAFATLYYAYSTESVNGEKGRNVPGRISLPTPDGPQGTFGAPGGGGLDHTHEQGDAQ